MLVCRDYQNHLVMAISRTSRKTVAIVLETDQRRNKEFFNVEFDANYIPINESPIKLAEVWLKSTIPLSQRARKELEMIYAIKSNKVVSITEEAPEAVKGVTQVSTAEDLKTMRLSAIVSLHNNCVTEEEKVKNFPTLDEAVAATFAVLQKYSIPEKAEKPKREKKEKVAKEPRVTDRSRIREFLADKQSFTIDDIVGLVGGTKSNSSTTITLLIKKPGKEGPIPFVYDKAAKVYNRVEA